MLKRSRPASAAGALHLNRSHRNNRTLLSPSPITDDDDVPTSSLTSLSQDIPSATSTTTDLLDLPTEDPFSETDSSLTATETSPVTRPIGNPVAPPVASASTTAPPRITGPPNPPLEQATIPASYYSSSTPPVNIHTYAVREYPNALVYGIAFGGFFTLLALGAGTYTWAVRPKK
ncbi:hypothetical protein HDU67_000220 [Dinochytrium kinnereticum]|nr:hypothetical protein HDU67_000220 [Dinochytrium kinnereticum]